MDAEKGTQAVGLRILRPAQDHYSGPDGPLQALPQDLVTTPLSEAGVETLLRDPADAPEGSARLDPVPADPAPPVKARSTCTWGRTQR